MVGIMHTAFGAKPVQIHEEECAKLGSILAVGRNLLEYHPKSVHIICLMPFELVLGHLMLLCEYCIIVVEVVLLSRVHYISNFLHY